VRRSLASDLASTVKGFLRWCGMALVLGGLAGCALGAFALPFYLIYGGGTAAGLLVGTSLEMHEAQKRRFCHEVTSRGIEVSESTELRMPTDEGDVRTYEAAWQSALAEEGYPKVEPRRLPVSGKLIVTERSVLLVPPPGTAGVRIPYEGVQNIEVRNISASGMPYTIIVNSACGRYDIFTYVRREGTSGLDPDATTAVAKRLKDSVALLRAAAARERGGSH